MLVAVLIYLYASSPSSFHYSFTKDSKPFLQRRTFCTYYYRLRRPQILYRSNIYGSNWLVCTAEQTSYNDIQLRIFSWIIFEYHVESL